MCGQCILCRSFDNFEEITYFSEFAQRRVQVFMRHEEDRPRNRHDFLIHTHPLPPSDDFFQISVVVDGSGEGHVSELYRHDDHYGGLGIADAILPLLPDKLGLRIRSSDPGLPDESRSDDATGVWERLERLELAERDPARDVFWLTNKPDMAQG